MGNTVSAGNNNHPDIEYNSPNNKTNSSIDPLTLKSNNTSKEIFNSQDFNPKFVPNMSVPTNVNDFLKSSNVTRTQKQQNEIDKLKAEYNDITNKLNLLQIDEKNKWDELNEARDPNYTTKRDTYLIYQKTKKLKEQRNKVMSILSSKYNASLDENYNQNMIKRKNQDTLELQGDNIVKSSTQINQLNNDIMTKRRQDQINIYQYHYLNNQVLMLKIMFMGILFCCLTLLLSIMGIGTDHFDARVRGSPPLIYMYLLIISILTILGVMIVYIRVKDINDLDWNVFDYDTDPPTLGSTLGM